MAHEAQSRIVPGPVKFKDKPEQDESALYMANHHYKALFFDPYRLVHLPARPLRVATETGPEMTDGVPVSVIILDDQHRVIGETELPYPLGMVGGAWIDRDVDRGREPGHLPQTHQARLCRRGRDRHYAVHPL